jgi:hypothetical protein
MFVLSELANVLVHAPVGGDHHQWVDRDSAIICVRGVVLKGRQDVIGA